MSENTRQFETDIVINDKSQGTVARHLRYCDNLLQIHCWVCLWKNFKNQSTFGKVTGKKADCLKCSVHMSTVLLKRRRTRNRS